MKTLKALFPQASANPFEGVRVLVVGAGGLGCELLKNFSKIGLKRVDLIDLDTIQLTNLNRQFYFKNRHKGKGKAEVLKEQILKINPDMQINAFTQNLMSPKFDPLYFKQFQLVFSALDNEEIRNELGKKCLRAGIPMINAGTEGYSGNSQIYIRGKTYCYSCTYKLRTNDNQNFAICTVRDSPQRNIHCYVWAKNLFSLLFSPSQKSMYQAEGVDKIRQGLSDCSDQQLLKKAKSLFRQQFSDHIKYKIKLAQLAEKDLDLNPCDFVPSIELIKGDINRHADQLPVQQYASLFIVSFVKIVKNNRSNIENLTFQKDDEDSMNFIFAASMLRIFNFKSAEIKLQFKSFYTVKDQLGKVIPAIASTNAICSALQTNFMVKYLTKGNLDCMKVYVSNWWKKIEPKKNYDVLGCHFCNFKRIYETLTTDFSKTTIQDLVSCLQNYSHCNQIKLQSSGKYYYRSDRPPKSLKNVLSLIFKTKSVEINLIFDNIWEVKVSLTLVDEPGIQGIRFNLGQQIVLQAMNRSSQYMLKRELQKKKKRLQMALKPIQL